MRWNRRGFLQAGAAGSLATTLRLAYAAYGVANAPLPPEGGTRVTRQLISFAHALKYAQLPEIVVHAAKRYVLDALGCAVAGWRTDKGRIAAEAMAPPGAGSQARILGSTLRTSAENAAFANAELMNGLDYDALPHIPPCVIPAVLALAEARRASGRELLTACVIAHEVSARLSSASSQMIASLAATGQTPEVFGVNDESIMGAAAGMANLLGLTETQTAHAIGLAAYYCPPQSSHDWETGTPKSLVKYTPVGCIARNSLTAALLAQRGFTGNAEVLDGPAGFPTFYGWPAWKPETAVRELGTTWRIETVDFKPHACCRFIHSQIDCLIALMREHGLRPEQVRSIHSLGVPFVANPDQRAINTQPDAQFSIPFMLATIAVGLPIDAYAQDAARLQDPRIRAMMDRITWGVHPDAERSKRADPRSYIARVQVTTSEGRNLVTEALYARGTGAIADSRLSDNELNRKFLENATTRLSAKAAQRAADQIWKLEAVPDITRVVRALT